MNDASPSVASETVPGETKHNAAWAAVNTPLSQEQMLSFCHADIERLLRINPYLEFETWSVLDDNRIEFKGVNHSQVPSFDFDFILTVEPQADGLLIHYDKGIKQSTRFSVESDESKSNSKLTIHETYHQVADQQSNALPTVDRSLTTWAGDIQKFLIMWKQWSWLPPWRWYMRRFWQPMKPSGRRIAYMFWWITVVEIALIILGVAVYWVEYR